jgi:hypothetical protein
MNCFVIERCCPAEPELLLQTGHTLRRRSAFCGLDTFYSCENEFSSLLSVFWPIGCTANAPGQRAQPAEQSAKFPGKLVAGMFSLESGAFFQVPPPVKEAPNIVFANP